MRHTFWLNIFYLKKYTLLSRIGKVLQEIIVYYSEKPSIAPARLYDTAHRAYIKYAIGGALLSRGRSVAVYFLVIHSLLSTVFQKGLYSSQF